MRLEKLIRYLLVPFEQGGKQEEKEKVAGSQWHGGCGKQEEDRGYD